MKSTKKPTGKSERSTLRKIQQIAKRPTVSTETKPPTDGITSSADALASDLHHVEQLMLHVAATHHIQPTDVLREMQRRISP